VKKSWRFLLLNWLLMMGGAFLIPVSHRFIVIALWGVSNLVVIAFAHFDNREREEVKSSGRNA
jgi:hypothetical protein